MKQYTNCTFKDLIMERILFKPEHEAKTILEGMFPNSKVSVVVGVKGITKVKVDNAVMTITPTKIGK